MSDGTDVVSQLTELVTKASEGDKQAFSQLLEKIESVPVMPADVAETLGESLGLLIADPAKAATDAGLEQLAMDCASRGVDSMLIRDCIAAVARSKYADYADPAGMIRAIGVLQTGTPIQEVVNRFAMFAELKEGACVWHDSYRFGRIVEIDPFGGQVYIMFSNKQNFALEQTLLNLSLAKADSIVAKIRSKEIRFDKNTYSADFDKEVAGSFLPALESPRQVVEALLIPDFMGHGEFISWRERGAKVAPKPAAPVATDNSSPAPLKVETTTVEPADASVLPELPDPNDIITWENARSLQELELELGKVDQIEMHQGHVEHYLKLYTFAAGRPKFDTDFALSLIQLISMSKTRDIVDVLISRIPKDAHVWVDREAFVTVSCSLKAKQMEKWLHICWVAQGQEWFLKHVMTLPLRFWSYAEGVLGQEKVAKAELARVALETFRTRNASADVVVWLWKQGIDEAHEIFANPRITFEVLAIGVAGEFIKARKLLHDLVMSNEDFQAALMDGGSLEGIENFVKTVRGTKSIEHGERQSLLVKIVRQFPEAREFVEEKKGKLGSKKMPKRSSFRSVELYQAELTDIINVQIPGNAKAIGEARSYGDLRENFEFKAAKERQRLLSSRRGELERALGEIVPTDFSEVEADEIVVPGVTVTIDVNGTTQTYHLLGLWDSDPERHIISYDAPLGRAMMGSKLGEEFTTPQDEEGTIVAIEELPEDIKTWVKGSHE